MIVIAYGGTGSTHIMNNAFKVLGRKNVHKRPDVNMKPEFWPEGKDIELPDYNGYDLITPEQEYAYFSKRTNGYQLQRATTTDDNLRAYVKHTNNEAQLAVMTWATWWQFFSRNRIKNVVFVIRHPLHQCLSWIHPTEKGHGKSFKKHGDSLFTVAGLDVFIRIWNANVDEYLRLRHLMLDPVAVRYEYMDNDRTMIPGEKFRDCFVDFRMDRRHFDILPKDLEQRLEQRCMWDIFYDKWNI